MIRILSTLHCIGHQPQKRQGSHLALRTQSDCSRRLNNHISLSPCSFHGIQPSKNTRERRAKKAAEEVAKKRMASETGATAEKSSLQQMKEVGWHGRLGRLPMQLQLLCVWWCNCREGLAAQMKEVGWRSVFAVFGGAKCSLIACVGRDGSRAAVAAR